MRITYNSRWYCLSEYMSDRTSAGPVRHGLIQFVPWLWLLAVVARMKSGWFDGNHRKLLGNLQGIILYHIILDIIPNNSWYDIPKQKQFEIPQLFTLITSCSIKHINFLGSSNWFRPPVQAPQSGVSREMSWLVNPHWKMAILLEEIIYKWWIDGYFTGRNHRTKWWIFHDFPRLPCLITRRF
jgi:hypothetical protein